ncbi:unnamed protein product [Heligmosomoides polygyrus]|uniref:Uncharacterized protein n=1 Tax=Heligmosomoides polygyrus TaxID=6339 RepID=A0A183FPQ9_HELPZ|nr:unnamed protein product [Heligmosomoides polygyrus]
MGNRLLREREEWNRTTQAASWGTSLGQSARSEKGNEEVRRNLLKRADNKRQAPVAVADDGAGDGTGRNKSTCSATALEISRDRQGKRSRERTRMRGDVLESPSTICCGADEVGAAVRQQLVAGLQPSPAMLAHTSLCSSLR